ncbi:hypothetical protein R3P38DRAFT_3205085 [Favolaschia claudopus]|uniref:Uncharacterized protein n=1 Tax=Favolaschia claudopus TaxID=2862362 RepID=A0AAW0APS3_9AGAR
MKGGADLVMALDGEPGSRGKWAMELFSKVNELEADCRSALKDLVPNDDVAELRARRRAAAQACRLSSPRRDPGTAQMPIRSGISSPAFTSAAHDNTETAGEVTGDDGEGDGHAKYMCVRWRYKAKLKREAQVASDCLWQAMIDDVHDMRLPTRATTPTTYCGIAWSLPTPPPTATPVKEKEAFPYSTAADVREQHQRWKAADDVAFCEDRKGWFERNVLPRRVQPDFNDIWADLEKQLRESTMVGTGACKNADGASLNVKLEAMSDAKALEHLRTLVDVLAMKENIPPSMWGHLDEQLATRGQRLLKGARHKVATKQVKLEKLSREINRLPKTSK